MFMSCTTYGDIIQNITMQTEGRLQFAKINGKLQLLELNLSIDYRNYLILSKYRKLSPLGRGLFFIGTERRKTNFINCPKRCGSCLYATGVIGFYFFKTAFFCLVGAQVTVTGQWWQIYAKYARVFDYLQ